MEDDTDAFRPVGLVQITQSKYLTRVLQKIAMVLGVLGVIISIGTFILMYQIVDEVLSMAQRGYFISTPLKKR